MADAELTSRSNDSCNTYRLKQTLPNTDVFFADDGVLLGLATTHPELQSRFTDLVHEIRRHGGQESRKNGREGLGEQGSCELGSRLVKV